MAGPGSSSRKRKRCSPSTCKQGSRPKKGGKDSRCVSGLEEKKNVSPISKVRRHNDLPDILYEPEISERYVLGKVLGKGTYGVVLAAWDKKDKIPVAIKLVVRRAAKWTRKGQSSMPMEVYLQKRLHHPNVVELLDYVSNDKYIAMVLERPVGYISLAEYLHRIENQTGEPITEGDAKVIFKNVARGMLYCLCRQVFHQDLSICNILVHPESLDAKIIDFGLADVINPNGHYKIMANLEANPPEYWQLRNWFSESMQAQQFNDESAVFDPPKPVYAEKVVAWACGVVLHRMVTGKNVYDETKVVHLSFDGTSKGFQRMISKLLSPEPDSRMSLHRALIDEYLR